MRGKGCPVRGGVQEIRLRLCPCPSTLAMPPLGGAVGSHGWPRLMVGDANRCAVLATRSRWVPGAGCPAVEGLSATLAASGDM